MIEVDLWYSLELLVICKNFVDGRKSNEMKSKKIRKSSREDTLKYIKSARPEFSKGRYFWQMPFREKLFHETMNPSKPPASSDSEWGVTNNNNTWVILLVQGRWGYRKPVCGSSWSGWVGPEDVCPYRRYLQLLPETKISAIFLSRSDDVFHQNCSWREDPQISCLLTLDWVYPHLFDLK